MRAILVTRPPCRLRRGELRRLPQNSGAPVLGYYLCCPHCGFVNASLQGADGLTIIEQERSVTFSAPVRCVYCAVLMHLNDSILLLEEDQHVRRLCYR